MQDTQFKNELIDIIDEKIAESGGGLPEVTAADNGKVLGVDDGEWKAVEAGMGFDAIIKGEQVDGDLTVSVYSGDFATVYAKLQGNNPCIMIYQLLGEGLVTDVELMNLELGTDEIIAHISTIASTKYISWTASGIEVRTYE